MALREYTDGEYERLQRSERELTGNHERATITDVSVVDSSARLTFGFDWTAEPSSVSYDLDDDRDVGHVLVGDEQRSRVTATLQFGLDLCDDTGAVVNLSRLILEVEGIAVHYSVSP